MKTTMKKVLSLALALILCLGLLPAGVLAAPEANTVSLTSGNQTTTYPDLYEAVQFLHQGETEQFLKLEADQDLRGKVLHFANCPTILDLNGHSIQLDQPMLGAAISEGNTGHPLTIVNTSEQFLAGFFLPEGTGLFQPRTSHEQYRVVLQGGTYPAHLEGELSEYLDSGIAQIQQHPIQVPKADTGYERRLIVLHNDQRMVPEQLQDRYLLHRGIVTGDTNHGKFYLDPPMPLYMNSNLPFRDLAQLHGSLTIGFGRQELRLSQGAVKTLSQQTEFPDAPEFFLTATQVPGAAFAFRVQAPAFTQAAGDLSLLLRTGMEIGTFCQLYTIQRDAQGVPSPQTKLGTFTVDSYDEVEIPDLSGWEGLENGVEAAFYIGCPHADRTRYAYRRATCTQPGRVEAEYCAVCDQWFIGGQPAPWVRSEADLATQTDLHGDREPDGFCNFCGRPMPYYEKVTEQSQLVDGGTYLLLTYQNQKYNVMKMPILPDEQTCGQLSSTTITVTDGRIAYDDYVNARIRPGITDIRLEKPENGGPKDFIFKPNYGGPWRPMAITGNLFDFTKAGVFTLTVQKDGVLIQSGDLAIRSPENATHAPHFDPLAPTAENPVELYRLVEPEPVAHAITVTGGKAYTPVSDTETVQITEAVAGTHVDLVADARDGYVFKCWNGGPSTDWDRHREKTTFIMPNEPVTVEAAFRKDGMMLSKAACYVHKPVAGLAPDAQAQVTYTYGWEMPQALDQEAAAAWTPAGTFDPDTAYTVTLVLDAPAGTYFGANSLGGITVNGKPVTVLSSTVDGVTTEGNAIQEYADSVTVSYTFPATGSTLEYPIFCTDAQAYLLRDGHPGEAPVLSAPAGASIELWAINPDPDRPNRFTFQGFEIIGTEVPEAVNEKITITMPAGPVTVLARFTECEHTFGPWQECDMGHARTCSKCGYQEFGDHAFGEWTEETTPNGTFPVQICTICGAKHHAHAQEHAHVPDAVWHSDPTGHWHLCTGDQTGCGAAVDFAEHTFTPWETAADGTKTRTCTVCGYLQTLFVDTEDHICNTMVVPEETDSMALPGSMEDSYVVYDDYATASIISKTNNGYVELVLDDVTGETAASSEQINDQQEEAIFREPGEKSVFSLELYALYGNTRQEEITDFEGGSAIARIPAPDWYKPFFGVWPTPQVFRIEPDGTKTPMETWVEEDRTGIWGRTETYICWRTDSHSLYMMTPQNYYGRASLTPDEQKAYDAISAGVYGKQKSIDLSDCSLTSNGFWKVMERYRCDHPEQIALTGQASYGFRGGKIIYCKPGYLTGLSEADFRSAAETLLQAAEGKRSDYAKALALHDALVAHTEYGGSDDEAHSAYGALVNKLAVCEGYAKAYQYLLQQVGIQSYIVNGTGNGGGHAWNLVRLDGKYYYTDVTWDDPVTSGGGLKPIYHGYMNLTEQDLLTDHQFGSDFSFIKPTANDRSQLYHESVKLSTADAAKAKDGLRKLDSTGRTLQVSLFDTSASGNVIRNTPNLFRDVASQAGINGYSVSVSACGREVLLTYKPSSPMGSFPAISDGDKAPKQIISVSKTATGRLLTLNHYFPRGMTFVYAAYDDNGRLLALNCDYLRDNLRPKFTISLDGEAYRTAADFRVYVLNSRDQAVVPPIR